MSTYITVTFKGSKALVEAMEKKYLEEFPARDYDTFFHSLRFVGYTEAGQEQWAIIGNRRARK